MNKFCGSSQDGELNTCICPRTATLGPTANLTHSKRFEIGTAKEFALTCCPTNKPIGLCPVLSNFPRLPMGEYQLPSAGTSFGILGRFLYPLSTWKLEQQA